MSATTAEQRPNVLFLLTDEHSYRFLDGLPEAEGEPIRTPTLSALAARGTRFDATYCAYPLCTPSRLSLLTGREPQRCGAWTNGMVLREDYPTIGDVFSNAGWSTALLGKMHLGGDRQFCGFQHRPFGDLCRAAGHQPDPIEASRRVPEAMRSRTVDAGLTEIPESMHQENVVCHESVTHLREHVDRHPDQPWFLLASFCRPHFPLTAPRRHLRRHWPDQDPPPKVAAADNDHHEHPMTIGMREMFRLDEMSEQETRRSRAAYFACIEYVDEIIGDFLAVLDRDGLLDNTVIVYTSDHGEMAGEHGLWWKQTWHEASTRVPMIIQTPEQRRGEAPAHLVTTPVSLIDLLPTLASLAGAGPVPDGVDGVDLSDSVLTGTEPARGPVTSDRLAPSFGAGTEFRMVRFDQYKYVGFRDAPELLFDLGNDPLECHNVADDPRHGAALARGRALVAEGIDFDRVEAAMAADVARTDHPRRAERGTGNAFILPDQRVVDADTTLYAPLVLAPDPEAAFCDWPGREPVGLDGATAPHHVPESAVPS